MSYPKRLGLKTNYPSMNIYELTRQAQQDSDERRYKTKMLQIEILKKPKKFSETLEFKIKTDLKNDETVNFAIMDSDSIWSDKPSKEDTELVSNTSLRLGSAKYVTNFTEEMQKKAFKDTEFDTAECYIKISHPKVGNVYSEIFDIDKYEFKNKQISVKKCFCSKEISSNELKNIIIELRKREVYIEKGRLIKDTNGVPILKNGKKQFTDITMFDELGEKLFNLDYPEKINPQEANFTKFANALNKTFKDYEINTCIRKIHFLAQCYHETQRFTITYEKNPNSNVSGGSYYRGRGLIQLTHNYNYEKLKNALKISSNLDEFVPRVAKEIDLACQASGYFWKNIGAKTGNINQYADKDDVLTVSREINGYVSVPNGFNDRKLFTNILKKVMHYDECKNKK